MLTPAADGVLVHRSELLANNAVVVVGPDGVLVVDPGLTEAELTCLASDVRRLGLPVVAGFATHPDWDHVLWHPDLGPAPRYATAAAATSMRDFRDAPDWRVQAAAALPEEIVDETPLDLFGLVTALPPGTTHLPWDGPAVRVVEQPAHAVGHAALVVEGSRVLIAGDMLSDVFPPMPDDSTDPLGDYLAGLDALEAVADDVDLVVPGHGSVGHDVRARIALDRAYVEAKQAGRRPADPRLDSPQPGWEWVADAFG